MSNQKLLIFLPLIGLTLIQAEIEDEEKNPITYQCEQNEIFVSNIRSINNQGAIEFMTFYCTPPIVCGKTEACITTIGSSCSAKSQYLAGIQKMEDGSMISTCCQITPPIKGEEPCHEYDILDKMLQGYKYLGNTKISSSRASKSLNRPSRASDHISTGMTADSRNKGTPVTIQEKTDLMLFQVKDQKPSVEFVKSIQKISNGYRVKICQPQCDRSTTSTMTPRTNQPTKPQEHKNEVPKKILRGRLGQAIHGCFSGDMTVLTSNGSKRMDQLHVGDKVQVLTSEFDQKFQPIEWFYHRDIDHVIEYINLMTKSGRHLSLTPNHLIPFVPCHAKIIDLLEMDKFVSTSTYFASRAKIGLCVATKIDQEKFMPDPIVSATKEQKIGVFSPITSQGTIVVNGIQTSCYSSLENQPVQRSIHSLLIKANQLIQSISQWFNNDSIINERTEMEEKNIPTVLAFLLELAKVVLPSHVYN